LIVGLAVGDTAVVSAGLVDRPLPVDLVSRPEDHPADGMCDRVEGVDVAGPVLGHAYPSARIIRSMARGHAFVGAVAVYEDREDLEFLDG
jgi:hypothetical protein